MTSEDYPVFGDVKRYLALRVKDGIWGAWKRHREEQAIRRCLRETSGIVTVCDVPTGPGRLFPFWHRCGFRIVGVDFSEPMVGAANKQLVSLGCAASVRQGDAFHLASALDAPPCLVASVRFLYYFEREKRVALLQSLASATARYVLFQFRTRETWKGRAASRRMRVHGPRHRGSMLARHFSSNAEVREEVFAAGLELLRIQPGGRFSDRAFAICARPK